MSWRCSHYIVHLQVRWQIVTHSKHAPPFITHDATVPVFQSIGPDAGRLAEQSWPPALVWRVRGLSAAAGAPLRPARPGEAGAADSLPGGRRASVSIDAIPAAGQRGGGAIVPSAFADDESAGKRCQTDMAILFSLENMLKKYCLNIKTVCVMWPLLQTVF